MTRRTALQLAIAALREQLAASQAEVADAGDGWLIEIGERFANPEDSKAYIYITNLRTALGASQAEVRRLQRWIDANPDRKRAFELDSEWENEQHCD